MTQTRHTQTPTPAPALAIVLARAGSKGLPQKNMLDVAGKPMLAWTLEHALGSASIDRVVLSTDGEALADIGRQHAGVEVVLRPDELASDTATVDAAARHAVSQIVSLHRNIVILYGNIPVRPADLTDRAVAMLNDTGADSVQSVCPVGKHHPYWMKQLGVDHQLIAYEDNAIYRRQDLPPVYELDGGIIAVTREALFNTTPGEPHAFLGNDRRAITTQPGEVIDVDHAIDLHRAQAVLSQRPAPKRKRNAG
ncbi:MAG: acylneuraminate cytidylyltransferase family protein [Planctomycetota bacterium]